MSVRFATTLIILLVWFIPADSFANPFRILWLNASVEEPKANTKHRQQLARFLNDYQNGEAYDVSYKKVSRSGQFARYMNGKSYDLIVVDAANFRRVFNNSDLDAFRTFYASGRRAIMLDGSLWIRNTEYSRPSTFPGDNKVLAGLLVNQIHALEKAGGGLLIGTDHGRFQNVANQVVRALLPDARFSGETVPSTDGDFVGNTLLATKESIKPADVLRHWASIPNQGQAPTGSYVDFTGQSVTLHSLVEISDRPGGKRRRPYVSFTERPDEARYSVNSEALPELIEDNLPTRKSINIQ